MIIDGSGHTHLCVKRDRKDAQDVSFYAELQSCGVAELRICGFAEFTGFRLRNLGHIRSADVSSYADSEIVLGAVAPGGTAAPNDGYK